MVGFFPIVELHLKGSAPKLFRKKGNTTINLKDNNGEAVPIDGTSQFINAFYANVGNNLAEAFVHLPGDVTMTQAVE